MSKTYTSKGYKKQVMKWDRIIKKWGHVENSLYDLYKEAEEKNEYDFMIYLKKFIKEYEEKKKEEIQKELELKNKAIELKNKAIERRKNLKEYKWNITTNEKVKFIDIMIEQIDPFNYITI
jgi:phosphoglycolate phosphatase-like HAD superfamily hydrolase